MKIVKEKSTQQIKSGLPGRPFSAKYMPKEVRPGQTQYYITHATMGLELIGSPDKQGLYSTSQLMWWHKAEAPFNDTGLKRGDPCSLSLDEFELSKPYYNDGRAGYGAIPDNTVMKFKSLDVLHGACISPSTVCNTCGYHIYIYIGFENMPDPEWL